MQKNKSKKTEIPKILKLNTQNDKPKVARHVDVSCGEGVSC